MALVFVVPGEIVVIAIACDNNTGYLHQVSGPLEQRADRQIGDPGSVHSREVKYYASLLDLDLNVGSILTEGTIEISLVEGRGDRYGLNIGDCSVVECKRGRPLLGFGARLHNRVVAARVHQMPERDLVGFITEDLALIVGRKEMRVVADEREELIRVRSHVVERLITETCSEVLDDNFPRHLMKRC